MTLLAFVAGIVVGVWSCVVLFVVALLIVGSPRVPDNERAAPDDEDADDDILGPYGIDGRPADSPHRGSRLRDDAGDAGRPNHDRPAAHAPHRSHESGGTSDIEVHPVRAGRPTRSPRSETSGCDLGQLMHNLAGQGAGLIRQPNPQRHDDAKA